MPPNRYRQRRGPRPQRKRTGARAGAVLTETAPVRPAGPVELPNPVVVKDFAEILGVSIAEIINVLIRNGIFATVNQSIDFDTASLVAGELGFETIRAAELPSVPRPPRQPRTRLLRPVRRARRTGAPRCGSMTTPPSSSPARRS